MIAGEDNKCVVQPAITAICRQDAADGIVNLRDLGKVAGRDFLASARAVGLVILGPFLVRQAARRQPRARWLLRNGIGDLVRIVERRVFRRRVPWFVRALEADINEAEEASFDLDEITELVLEEPERSPALYDLGGLDKLLQRPPGWRTASASSSTSGKRSGVP